MPRPPRKTSRPAPGERDKRAALRREISYPVTIETIEKGTQHPCMILDISETGARLSLRQTAEIPEDFLLRLAGNRAAARLCRIVWRDGETIGARFVEVDGS